MFTKKKLKAEIVRLTYRVADLEERLCPCESHAWKKVGSHICATAGGHAIDTVYHYKCARCGKTKESPFFP